MLDSIERVSKTFSIAAIPVVLAVGGWLIQRGIADQSAKKEYVQMAISILNSKGEGSDASLRQWAVDLLNANSPVKIPEDLSKKLQSGAVGLLELRNHELFTKNLSSKPDEQKQITLNDGRTIRIEAYPSGDVMIRSQKRFLWLEKDDFEVVAGK